MQEIPFELTDIAIVAVLVVSGLLAYFRGFVREVLSVGGWIGAALAALYGFPVLRPYAREWIKPDIFADIATGAGLFFATLVILSLISHVIARSVRDSAVGSLDRSLGFVFGVLRGAVLICLVYIGALWFWTEEQLPDFVTEARAMPLVRSGADFLLALVPEDARRKTDDIGRSSRRKMEEAIRTERILRDLIKPHPRETGEKPTASPGYAPQERREMQRLIESNQ